MRSQSVVRDSVTIINNYNTEKSDESNKSKGNFSERSPNQCAGEPLSLHTIK